MPASYLPIGILTSCAATFELATKALVQMAQLGESVPAGGPQKRFPKVHGEYSQALNC